MSVKHTCPKKMVKTMLAFRRHTLKARIQMKLSDYKFLLYNKYYI